MAGSVMLRRCLLEGSRGRGFSELRLYVTGYRIQPGRASAIHNIALARAHLFHQGAYPLIDFQ